jgi:hypothetical protein
VPFAEQIRFGLDLLEDVLNMSRSTSLYSLNFDHATWLRLQLTTVADVKRKFGLPCQYQSTIITEQVLSVGAIDHVVIELSPRAVQHVEKMAKALNESELAYDRNFGKGKTLRCVGICAELKDLRDGLQRVRTTLSEQRKKVDPENFDNVVSELVGPEIDINALIDLADTIDRLLGVISAAEKQQTAANHPQLEESVLEDLDRLVLTTLYKSGVSMRTLGHLKAATNQVRMEVS